MATVTNAKGKNHDSMSLLPVILFICVDSYMYRRTTMIWHTGVPPEPGAYLVTVRWMGKMKIFVDYYHDVLGFMEFHDDVAAWAYLPEPYKEERS